MCSPKPADCLATGEPLKRGAWGALLAGLAVLVAVTAAEAWTAEYSWQATAGATSYRVEKSTDQGATWVLAASPTSPALVYTGTEPGLVLFRVSACNAVSCTVRPADGLWHDESKQPPAMPASLGVK
jgi:hypothetical protein